MVTIPPNELAATLARLRAEKAKRAQFEAHPDQIAEARGIDGEPVLILTGVSRCASFGHTDVPTPPDAPSTPPDRDRSPTLPPTQRPTDIVMASKPADTNTPTPVTVTIRDNSAAGLPDDVASAFYVVTAGEVVLVRADGRVLDNGAHKVSLRPFEDARGAAERLLKKRHNVGNDFTAQRIKYPPSGMI
jgi:hypothetical protein